MVDLARYADLFQANRAALLRLAQHKLGGDSLAEDAVQETWLRFSRTNLEAIQHPAAWLRQVLSRICIDMLRAQGSKREDPFDETSTQIACRHPSGWTAEEGALSTLLIRSALSILWQSSTPAQRIAFVLHDLFAEPFEAVGAYLNCSPGAAKTLASRARRRLLAASPAPNGSPPQAPAPVALAFARASHLDDKEGLLELLALDQE